MTEVTFESTPNPQCLKFNISKEISTETVNLSSALEAQRSPLAAKIFGFPWTEAIFIGTNYITVTKQDWVEWDVIAEPLSGLIQEHIDLGEPVLVELAAPSADAGAIHPDDTPVVQQIKKILNEEIRPAVAMDGGDIVFSKYEDNIVYIHMQGACAGCPSSAETLKHGVESRLCSAIPEIKEVVSL